jgi:hypothetical protein
MSDSKIGVGGTIGIVVGITAILGLGLYLILKPKSNVQAAYVPPPTTDKEVEYLKAQLALLKQQQANNPSLSQQQRDANDAQIQGIGIALGGKLLGAGIDALINKWTTPKNSVYGNTSLASGVPDGYMLDNPTGTVGRYDYLNPWSQTTLVKSTY